MKKHKIVVGMSGGVDSSVSAYLLKQQGHDVTGFFMKNWEEADVQGVCMSTRDYEDVSAVCSQIGIPYYSVNFVKEYREAVFEKFLDDCKAGLTPNPDVLCNREIKFKVFMNKAMEFGADFLATGHYCRTQVYNDKTCLLKGTDPNKDQSYFLHAVNQSALAKTLFPIGHLLKSQVRAIAREASLATSEKKDSTGLCFIGERNFKQFLSQFIGFQSGPLLTLDGRIVGQHDGYAYYTIGQRKGIGLGGEGEAWFVVGKDPARNAVYVERGEKHPALYFDELIAQELTWINEPPSLPHRCFAKIRYRQKDVPCEILLNDDTTLRIAFNDPQRAVTPGQSIVFYDGDITLGGGVIRQAGPSYFERVSTKSNF
ncbi:MAG: tRNA-specific 2-thiouridylase mnmA [Parachlamydiales bacterium]|nr:tRNA-specific 2-thiouridylase mnmA [Parachlamydiales bacterium]